MIEVAEGHRIEQDESGRIIQSELSSERAREIGAIPRNAKQRKQEAEELHDALVAVLPVLEDAERQAARDMLLMHLCRGAVAQKGQSSLNSIQALGQLVGQAFAATSHQALAPYRPGTICGHCGFDGGLKVTAAGLAHLRGLLRENAAMLLEHLEGNDGTTS